MTGKQRKAALALCAALLIAAVALALLFSPAESGGESHTAGVMLSEILPGNLTYPAPDGGCYDFIEVFNPSADPVDLSGYILSDRPDRIGYTFPDGTLLASGQRLICWCLADTQRTDMGNFGISRTGKETIYLYNATNTLLDQVQLPILPDNTAYARADSGVWQETTLVTPGYANDEAGFEAYLASMGVGNTSILITEVMTAASAIRYDGVSVACDYVELHNPGDTPVSLTGAYLSDDPFEPLKWRIDMELTLAPGGYAVIPCTGSDVPGQASFALPRGGCTVTLSGPLGNVLSSVTCPRLSTDEAFALVDGEYTPTDLPTPGYANSRLGYELWLNSLGLGGQNLVISEVMTSNRCTITDASGAFCDYVELYNAGDTAVELASFSLSDDMQERGMFPLPEKTLAPGEYYVVRCGGDGAAYPDADFALSASGCTVILTGGAGNIVSTVVCPSMEADRAYALQPDGTYAVTYRVSPGYPNTEEGADSFLAARVPTGLVISEVMPSNDKYLLQSDGEYHDWLELKNCSDAPIDLSGYYLSGNQSDLKRFPLPEKTLAPGEYLIVICSGLPDTPGRYLHAPFTLSKEDCRVYLSTEEGLADWFYAPDVPYRHSAGRPDGAGGRLYFTTPTPGAANAPGVAAISPAPLLLTPDGVYNGIDSLTVTLSGDAIRYTTDGSMPTERSPLYTSPLTLTETTVLRFASFLPGRLPSSTVTAAYILNENHTLPVLCLTTDESAMFSEDSGVYPNARTDTELPCNLKFFEDIGSFSIDCGVELSGAGLLLEKKSFRLNFRSRYGADYLGYGLFGDDGPMVFDALVLRAGQDHGKSLFRDELLSTLAHNFSDHVPAQRYRFTVLYINGRYWGIYALKEALGVTYYSQLAEVSAESVESASYPAPYGSELYELLRYCRENDMTLPESYAYVASRVDMDSLADWMVLQGYSGSSAIEGNLRFFRSVENCGKWALAFYDQDNAFVRHDELANLFADAPGQQYRSLTMGLIRNPTFRAAFLTRLSQARQGALSDEAVLSEIDRLQQLLLPEMERERSRWGGSVSLWLADVQLLRDFIGGGDHWDMILKNLSHYISLTDSERSQYFS